MKRKKLSCKKFVSVFLSLMMLFSLICSVNADGIQQQADASAQVQSGYTFNFTVQNEPAPSGHRTKAVIIDAEADVDASTISVDDFIVSARNTYTDSRGEHVFFDGNRPILNAYVAKENKLHAASAPTGRYIVLELDWDVGTGDNGENDGAKTCTPQWALKLNYSIQLVGSFSYVNSVKVESANFVQAEIVDLIVEDFQSGIYRGVPYRAYFNDTVEGPLPLVLYFHGGGQGNDNDCHVKFMNGATTWAYPENQAKYPCHVLAPANATTKEKMDSMVSLINEWIEAGLVDPDRIYVTGYSMGGMCTWDFLRYYPDIPAAALPMCGGGLRSVEEALAISELPIWEFTCKEDFAYAGNIRNAETYGPYLKNYKLSILEENHCPSQNYGKGYTWPGHAEWEPVYSGEYVETTGRGRAIDWLFAQKKQSEPTFMFDLINKSFPYDERNIGLIIDAEKDVDPTSISLDTFSVSAHNTYMRGNTEMVGYSGPREITKIYVNDKPEITSTPSNSGRYIVVELQHGVTTGVGPHVPDATYGGGTIAFKQNYTVTQNKAFKYANLTTVKPGDYKYQQALIRSDVIDKFVYGSWKSIKYRLFSPEDTSKRQPLIIIFHGWGQGGDNEVHLRFHNPATVWAYPENQAKYPCYVLAPSAPEGVRDWPEQALRDVKEYADRMIATGKVDPDRVYVVGYSMGGRGTWNFVSLFPDFPAAIAPLCAGNGPGSVEAANAIADLPIWYFVTKGDVGPYEAVMQTHETYSKYFKDYKLTILEESSLTIDGEKVVWPPHACWLTVFNGEYDENPDDPNSGTLQDWLFSKRKSDRASVTLTGPSTVAPGATFDIQVGLAGNIENIYAEDITVNYDANNFEFVNVTPANGRVIITRTENDVPGTVRVIAANTYGITGEGQLFNLTFRAKGSERSSGTFQATKIKLGSPMPLPNGLVITAAGGSINITITKPTVPPSGIQLSDTVLNMTIGSTKTLTATLIPANATPGRFVWSSDNESVAVVDESGNVTAVSVGTATITVSLAGNPGITATCKVTVTSTGDLNGDSKYDVADLAIAAYYYNAKVGSANWDEAKIADVNGDGIVDIIDLAAIARNIE